MRPHKVVVKVELCLLLIIAINKVAKLIKQTNYAISTYLRERELKYSKSSWIRNLIYFLSLLLSQNWACQTQPFIRIYFLTYWVFICLMRDLKYIFFNVLEKKFMCIYVFPLGGYFKGIFESNHRVGFGYFFHHDGSVTWSDFKDNEPVCIKGIADKEVEQEEVEEKVESAIKWCIF